MKSDIQFYLRLVSSVEYHYSIGAYDRYADALSWIYASKIACEFDATIWLPVLCSRLWREFQKGTSLLPSFWVICCGTAPDALSRVGRPINMVFTPPSSKQAIAAEGRIPRQTLLHVRITVFDDFRVMNSWGITRDIIQILLPTRPNWALKHIVGVGSVVQVVWEQVFIFWQTGW